MAVHLPLLKPALSQLCDASPTAVAARAELTLNPIQSCPTPAV
eukprot:COSAG02_NODE_4966_length_4774_cov_7.241925_8_plen_43_part_00